MQLSRDKKAKKQIIILLIFTSIKLRITYVERNKRLIDENSK